MKFKTTIIFVLALFSLAAVMLGVVTEQPVSAAEVQTAAASPVIQPPRATPELHEEDTEITRPLRYAFLEISQEDREEMARIIWLEARGEPAEGQQAVAEVILNRVLHESFPDTVHGVIHEGEDAGTVQFDTVYYLDEAQPGEDQYAAVSRAISGPWILEPDVVFFSADGENDRVYRVIGGHTFCREYIWE